MGHRVGETYNVSENKKLNIPFEMDGVLMSSPIECFIGFPHNRFFFVYVRGDDHVNLLPWP